MLLWLHGQSFGATDPVFHQDYSFFVFTLPVLDAIQALLWGGGARRPARRRSGWPRSSFALANTPTRGDPAPSSHPRGASFQDGFRAAVIHAGVGLAGVFVLAALGAHFGVYHLATVQHDNFVGLDATQRNVTRPVLGVLQWVALALAVVTAALVLVRRNRGPGATGVDLRRHAGRLAGRSPGVAQAIPAAIYQGASVNPNAQVAQTPSINDYLATSRYAWALQPSNVDVRSFGTVAAPTLTDLAADPGTLRNVRIQDVSQLPDTFAQIDRSRSYQTYPTITVDRYPSAPTVGTGDTEVMLGPREIAENDIPNASFINSALNYTHGYGITAVSVNAVAAEGKPQVLVGQQPLKQVSPDAPPGLTFNGAAGDPRIYCGLVDDPTGGDRDAAERVRLPGRAAATPPSTRAPRCRASRSTTSSTSWRCRWTRSAASTSSSTTRSPTAAGCWCTAASRTASPASRRSFTSTATRTSSPTRAPATSTTSPTPTSRPTGSPSPRCRTACPTCATPSRRWSTPAPAPSRSTRSTSTSRSPPPGTRIYPGLLQPLDSMPTALRSHLRYPEDLFTAQAQVYANVHVSGAAVFFNGSDRYRIAQQQINGQQQDTSRTTSR